MTGTVWNRQLLRENTCGNLLQAGRTGRFREDDSDNPDEFPGPEALKCLADMDSLRTAKDTDSGLFKGLLPRSPDTPRDQNGDTLLSQDPDCAGNLPAARTGKRVLHRPPPPRIPLGHEQKRGPPEVLLAEGIRGGSVCRDTDDHE